MKAITTSTTPHAMSPEALTAAIRHEHEAASTAARSALGHALECGRLLAEARAAIPHGSWETYVKDSCSIAPRTASLYLRLHRNRDRLPNQQHVADLSVRQAARLLERPKTQAETVAVKGRLLTLADVDPMSAILKEQRERTKQRAPTRQSKNARLANKLIVLMINIRRGVELLHENTSKQSNRRKEIASELRRLADLLVLQGATA